MNHSNFVQFDPLKCVETQKAFRELLEFCRLSRCNQFHLKLIDYGDEHVVTNNAKELLPNFQTNEPLVRLLLSVTVGHIKNHSDGGLNLPILVIYWLEKYVFSNTFCSLAYCYSHLELLGKKVLEYLDDPLHVCPFKYPVSFNNINSFICIVRNALRSKLKSSQLTSISTILIKCFIQSIPSSAEYYTPGLICFKTSPGKDINESCIVPGLLVSQENLSSKEIQDFIKKRSFSPNSYSCLVLHSADESVLEDVLQHWACKLDVQDYKSKSEQFFKQLEADLLNLNLDILACQTGVHSTLKLILKRNHILVLDRLGTESAEQLALISGTTVENINLLFSRKEKIRGFIRSVKTVILSNKEYLVLNGLADCDHQVQTFLVCDLSLEGADMMVCLMKKALNSLQRLLRCGDKTIIPGAGCAEAVLTSYIKKLVFSSQQKLSTELSCTFSQLITATDCFLEGLLSSANFTSLTLSSLFIDNTFGHLWNETSKQCCCGMIQISPALRLIPASTSILYWPQSSLSLATFDEEEERIVLIPFQPWREGLTTAFETSKMLMKTGVCIQEHD